MSTLKVEHLGKIVSVDPAVAALENSILQFLKGGPKRQHTVYVATGRRKNFFEVVEDLVQRNLVVRQTTTKRRVFILRAVSPKHPLYGKRIEIQEPLQPEAA